MSAHEMRVSIHEVPVSVLMKYDWFTHSEKQAMTTATADQLTTLLLKHQLLLCAAGQVVLLTNVTQLINLPKPTHIWLLLQSAWQD